MKTKSVLFFFVSLVFLLVVIKPVFSQQNKITIQINSLDNQLSFTGDEINKAAESKGYLVTLSKTLSAKSKDGIVIKIISDSLSAVKIAKADDLKMPKQFGWQCYSLRVMKKGKQTFIYILSGDETGAMYGGLDIAEAFRIGTINYFTDSDNNPYLERRGIKWNIPLDMRTPSYGDMGDFGQQNIPVVWEMDFWQQQFDQMARDRYNVISLWSENPFPSLVKIPEFPQIALNDVWRTKVHIGDDFNLSGRGLVTSEMLKNHEVVKKISIDEKIEFWKKVM
jgi:hypothetical protein